MTCPGHPYSMHIAICDSTVPPSFRETILRLPRGHSTTYRQGLLLRRINPSGASLGRCQQRRWQPTPVCIQLAPPSAASADATSHPHRARLVCRAAIPRGSACARGSAPAAHARQGPRADFILYGALRRWIPGRFIPYRVLRRCMLQAMHACCMHATATCGFRGFRGDSARVGCCDHNT